MGMLKDTFGNLKSSIVGTTTSKIDAKLDLAVKDIISYKSNSNRNSYIELIKGLISKNANLDINPGGAAGGLFGHGLNPSTFGQGKRLARYNMYESIVYNIDYCKRALNVLTDNILSPDDITKISLDVSPKNYLEDETPSESKTKYVEEIITKMELEDKLPMVIQNTLMHGDFFCEIGGEKTALTSQSILAESEILNNYDKSATTQTFNVNLNNEKYNINIDFSSYVEEKKTTTKDKDVNIDDVKLILHEASNVVRLQSGLFPICFGFLVFPPTSSNAAQMLEDDAVNAICSTLLKNIAKEIPQIKELSSDEDLKDIISSMLKYSNTSKAINIRYISPNKMVHFKVPSTKFYPYGESIFDAVQFSAKMLVALETSLTIFRLSRSTEKRKIAIEVGLPRDAKKVIEGLKETLRKRKISLDTMGSVDVIPSLISTFEDIYIPQKDGKPYVDISSFSEGNVDTGNKVDEIKTIRDRLISGLSIPPAFLGIDENVNAKNTLSEEHITFARAIISHQKYFTKYINELIKKVMDIIDPEQGLTLFDNVSVIIAPPKSLQFERENRYIADVVSLIEALNRIGVPQEYSKKKYLSNLDWDEIKKYKIDENIDKGMGVDNKEDESGMAGY